MKKCTGEVDDIDDIAKNVKIAMQKSHDKLDKVEVEVGQNGQLCHAKNQCRMRSDATNIEKTT